MVKKIINKKIISLENKKKLMSKNSNMFQINKRDMLLLIMVHNYFN